MQGNACFVVAKSVVHSLAAARLERSLREVTGLTKSAKSKQPDGECEFCQPSDHADFLAALGLALDALCIYTTAPPCSKQTSSINVFIR